MIEEFGIFLNPITKSFFFFSEVFIFVMLLWSNISFRLYLSNLISFGIMLSGLLTGAGVGLLILFRTNKNIKENMTILAIIYFVGVIIGYLLDIVGIV